MFARNQKTFFKGSLFLCTLLFALASTAQTISDADQTTPGKQHLHKRAELAHSNSGCSSCHQGEAQYRAKSAVNTVKRVI